LTELHNVAKALACLLATAATCCCLAATSQKPNALGTEQQPLVVKTVPASPTEEELKHDADRAQERQEDKTARQRSEERAEAHERVTDRIAIATIVVLLAQGAMFGLQALLMRRTIREMRAATAADQRPWIAIKGHRNINMARVPTGWEFHVQFDAMNTGKTPAQNIQVYAAATPLAAGIDVDKLHYELRDIVETLIGHPFESILFPGDTRILAATAVIDDSNLAGCVSGASINIPAVIYGCIFYRFPQEDSTHVTRFRYRLATSAGNLVLPANVPASFPPQLITPTMDEKGWTAD
jgi:hypothetical protein